MTTWNVRPHGSVSVRHAHLAGGYGSQAKCACGDTFDGATYEAAEDGWREHVYEQTGHVPRPMGDKTDRWQPTDAGSTTLAFLLTLATLCAVAWFAVPNVPGVVEAMGIGLLRFAGYAAVGCVVAAASVAVLGACVRSEA